MDEEQNQSTQPTTGIELQPPPSRRRGALLLACLAIIISIITLALQFYFWQFHQTLRKEFISQSRQFQIQVQNRVKALNERVDYQQNTIKQLLARTQAEENHNAVRAAEEAEYLVTLSSYNLLFSNNIELATKLLGQADQKLQQVNNPEITIARKSLVNDLTTLNSIPKMDIPGLLSRLSSISDQVSSLQLLPTATSSTMAVTNPKPLTWKERLLATLHKLQGILTIRRLQEPVKPLISPEQQTYAIENIRLKLNQAQWAVLHQEPSVYQNSLEQAKQNLQKYFYRDPKTATLIQMLSELQNTNIKPPLPDLSHTINLLHSAIATLQNLSLPSEKPPANSATTATPIPRALPS